MKINDSHVHSFSGLKDYDIHADHKNIIYNYIDEYQSRSSQYNDPQVYNSLIFDFHNQENLDFLFQELRNNRVHAIKIHSRIQKIRDQDYEKLWEKLQAVPANVPIIFDAFYDGPDFEYQPSLFRLTELCKLLPHHKIVVAHSGGYELLKYFFHLRTVPNIYFELSLSLHYLFDSHLYVDMVKLLKHVNKERIIFGSDYPYASPQTQVGNLEILAREAGLKKSEMELITYHNFFKIFGIK